MNGLNETHQVFNNSGNISEPSNGSFLPPGHNGPPPGFFFKPPEPTIYARVTNDLLRVIPPLIILIGTIGNVLTIIIILRQFRKMTSTSIFLLTLAISDTVILYSGPLRHWIMATWDNDVRGLSENGCKFSVFLTYASFHLSSWLLVAVTMERAISVLWPHKIKMGCTPGAAGAVITIMVVVILGLNSHFIYGFGRSTIRRSYCDPKYEDYNTFVKHTWPWVDCAVSFAIPFAFILLGNSVIIYKLRKSSNRRRRISMIQSHAHRVAERDAKVLTITLILLSIMFFICLTPVTIYFIYQPYRQKNILNMRITSINDYKELAKQVEILRLVFATVNCISYLNAMLNFFMYVVSGSKFRRELKSLFCCTGRRRVTSVFGGSTSHKASTTSSIVSTHLNVFRRQVSSESQQSTVSTLPADSGMESDTISVDDTSIRWSDILNEQADGSKEDTRETDRTSRHVKF